MIRFPEHSLMTDVLEGRVECLRRLSSSDLGIARFYERVENNEGMIYHAERALGLAMNANDADLIAAARALMPEIPAEDS